MPNTISMNSNECLILDIDEFDPVYFRKPNVREIKVFDDEAGVRTMIFHVKVGEDGRIRDMLHLPLGWLAYPPGYKPELRMSQLSTVVYGEDNGTVLVQTRDMDNERMVQEKQYIIEQGKPVHGLFTFYATYQAQPQKSDIIYDYDAAGRLVKMEHLLAGRVITRRIFHRDRDGVIFKEVQQRLEGDGMATAKNQFSEQLYRYDDSGRLKEILLSDQHQEFVRAQYFYNDEEYSSLHMIRRWEEDQLISERSFDYNADGNVQKIIVKNQQQQNVWVYKYT